MDDARWAHAVNCEELLSSALANERITMLEADVMHQPRGAAVLLVMAHPPKVPPDAMPFSVWLDRALAHNRSGSGRSKGIKLDFKSPSVVSPCLEALVARREEENLKRFSFPVWLNADVLTGPGGPPSEFDGPQFVEVCQRMMPEAVLSLGWTTGYPTTPADQEGYSDSMVDAMLALCNGHVREHAHVTFPLHAWYAHQSWTRVERLLARQYDAQNKALTTSITLWGKEQESPMQWVEVVRKSNQGRIHVDITPNDQ